MTPLLGRPGPRTVLEIRFDSALERPPKAGERPRQPRRVEPAQVSFRLVGRGDPTPSVAVPADSIGIPDTFDAILSRAAPPRFALPLDVETPLRESFAQVHPEGEPVWLDLKAPARLLALVPWERMLLPLACGPILRAPRLPLRPVVTRGPLRVVVCINVPPTAGVPEILGVLALLVDYRRALRSGAILRIYLFLGPSLGDREAAVVRSYLGRMGLQEVVIMLEGFEAGEEPERSDADLAGPPAAEVRHPWLRSILASVQGRGIDLVQIIAPARVFPGRASLDLAYRRSAEEKSEVSTSWVGAGEFDLFLTQIGAWAVDLYPLGDAWSAPALRLFAEELAWLNPGSIAAHAGESGGSGLAAALNVRGGTEPLDAAQLGSGLSIHDPETTLPDWDQRPGAERNALEGLTLAREALRIFLENGMAIGWVLAVQRHLERRVGMLLRDDFVAWAREVGYSEIYRMRRTGVEKGLRSVVEAVWQHLREVGFLNAVDPELRPPEGVGPEPETA